MEKSGNFLEKLFGSFAITGARIPLRGNIYRKGGGYSPISGGASRIFGGDRESPLLGNAAASNRLKGFYERILELKEYQLVDIAKLATNFFSDYITNFLIEEGSGRQIVTILNEDGSKNDSATDRINKVLLEDIKIISYIKSHVQDYVYYGSYYSMLSEKRDELGHLTFKVEELLDPVSVVRKRTRNPKTGDITETYLTRGDDDSFYEIPKNEVIFLAQHNLRLVNDMDDGKNKRGNVTYERPKADGEVSNREKVLKKNSYTASEPLLYSLILKIKELVIKELLVSLISLRDLSSTQIFLLQMDKSVPPDMANDLCARASKLANNTNELASFLSSQFNVVDFIQNTLTKPATFIPDYNSTLGGKNSLLPLDKLSDKLLEIMQTIDQCRAGILNPLGLPASITDSSSGNKWQILQQSERANSRVATNISGINGSVILLIQTIYEKLYGSELKQSLVKLHLFEKTSVEYNNQQNQADSIANLLNQEMNILQTSLTAMDTIVPFVDPQAWLSYIQNLLHDIDANASNLVTKQSLENYLQVVQAKFAQQCAQFELDPSQIPLFRTGPDSAN